MTTFGFGLLILFLSGYWGGGGGGEGGVGEAGRPALITDQYGADTRRQSW
jgi:hypothetical protein